MLTHLCIKNYALIRQLDLQPADALNIITGETGAGKSIMLGAIGLLLGNRADARLLYDADQKCVIEGTFDVRGYALQATFEATDLDYEDTCLLRREISPRGKSRAFVNDTPVTLDVLRQVAGHLLDIHSQHDNLQLGTHGYQLHVLDTFAGNQTERAAYEAAYAQFRRTEKHLHHLEAEAAQARRELDFQQFQLEELRAAQLQDGEQETLEAQLAQLEHAEDIKEKLHYALLTLDRADANAAALVQAATQALGRIVRFGTAYEQAQTRLQSCLIELQDVVAELEAAELGVEVEPARIEQVQDRLSELFTLQKKHHVSSTAELIALRDELARRVGSILEYDEQIATARDAFAAARQRLEANAETLRRTRQAVTANLEAELHRLLAGLGMPNATVALRIRPAPPGPSGTDEVELLFSANKGIAPQELRQVASGGEFARLMLSIKYVLADKTALPTIIFDEIDTGISGEIAIKMGKMMQQMGRRHQVIAITHLPQIAARGEAHYYVYKTTDADRTISNLRLLDEAGRVEEIAQMISGEPPTATSKSNARELLHDSRYRPQTPLP